MRLQQHLPFTVLKLPRIICAKAQIILLVATALTVHGIETLLKTCVSFKSFRVATALTVHGIETMYQFPSVLRSILYVATALTVHGIETLSVL